MNINAATIKVEWKFLLILYLGVLLLFPVDFYRFSFSLPFDVQFDRIAAVLVLGLWAIALLIDPKQQLRGSSLDYPVIFFVLVIILSLLANALLLDKSALFGVSAKRTLYILSVIFIFYFITSNLHQIEQVEFVLKFATVVVSIIGFFAILEFATGFNIFRHIHQMMPFLEFNPEEVTKFWQRTGRNRVFGSAEHPIALGLLLVMPVPIALHYYEYAKTKMAKNFYAVCLLLLLGSIFTVVSRTPLVALGVIFLILAFNGPTRILRLLLFLIPVLIVVHMLLPGLLGGLRELLSLSYFQQREIGNPYGRFADYPRMWSLFFEQPLFGRGYGWWDNYKLFYVDNQYLKFLVELGLAGILSVFWLFFKLLKELVQSAKTANSEHKDLLISIAATCSSFVVALILFDTFSFAQVTYFFFILAALGLTLSKFIKREAVGEVSAE